MRSINIEKLMGHSTGISDSYYRATESELLEDYLKTIEFLTISNEDRLRKQMEEVMEESRNNNASIKSQLYEKEQTVTNLVEKNSLNTDSIAALSDQVMKLMEEIERLKKERTNNNVTTHDNNNKLE
jgi:predicted  nucleic acid-binding Zn-ribbon protein